MAKKQIGEQAPTKSVFLPYKNSEYKKRENVWTYKTVGSDEDKELREKQYEKWKTGAQQKYEEKKSELR